MKLFRIGSAKNASKARKQPKALPQERIEKRKKGAWVKLEVKIGP